MNIKYEIRKVPAFRTIGYVTHTTNENNEGMQTIPSQWANLIQNNNQTKLLALMDQAPFGLIGMSVYNTDSDDNQKFDYYICASSTKVTPEDMSEYTVPEQTWAVFPCAKGGEQELMVRIVTEWLPTASYTFVNSGYETGHMNAPAPDIELYMPDGSSEIWIAVKEN